MIKKTLYDLNTYQFVGIRLLKNFYAGGQVSDSVSVSFKWRPRPKIEAETVSKLLQIKADVEIAANCP